MAKPRADLQYVAYRIDAAIREGAVAAIPIYPLTDDLQTLGRWPSSLFSLESFRRRMPPLYFDTREKYETKFERTWDNRSTIPPCLFNSRFVSVTSRSPDYDWLLQAGREERRAVQVIETSRGLKRRIYEIVRDLSHGQRSSVYKQDQYDDERARLETIRFELKERQRNHDLELLSLTQEELELNQLTSAQIGMRLEEINRIKADLVSRAAALQSYARQSNLRLFFLAQSLVNLRGSLIRTARFNRASLREYLVAYRNDLLLYGSKEVRPFRNNAKLLLDRILTDVQVADRSEIIRLLGMATEHVTRGAVVMTQWADKLPEDKRLMANFAFGQPAVQPQLL
ncbi:MAG: hypothetical protein WD187_01130 [Candidatus Woykebacteria bacterium]